MGCSVAWQTMGQLCPHASSAVAPVAEHAVSLAVQQCMGDRSFTTSAAIHLTWCTSPESSSTPVCVIIPKCHGLSLRDYCTARSCVILVFATVAPQTNRRMQAQALQLQCATDVSATLLLKSKKRRLPSVRCTPSNARGISETQTFFRNRRAHPRVNFLCHVLGQQKGDVGGNALQGCRRGTLDAAARREMASCRACIYNFSHDVRDRKPVRLDSKFDALSSSTEVAHSSLIEKITGELHSWRSLYRQGMVRAVKCAPRRDVRALQVERIAPHTPLEKFLSHASAPLTSQCVVSRRLLGR